MTRAILCITTLALVVMVVQRCRRCRCGSCESRSHLAAHDYAELWVERLPCPDKCDPRTDELQAWADLEAWGSYYEREDCE